MALPAAYTYTATLEYSGSFTSDVRSLIDLDGRKFDVYFDVTSFSASPARLAEGQVRSLPTPKAGGMKPGVTQITLGVEDLERAVEFYKGLTTPGIAGQEFEYGAVVFFGLQPGL